MSKPSRWFPLAKLSPAALAAVGTLGTLAGCGSRTFVGLGPTHSYGTVAVPGYQSGTGFGLEAGHYRSLGGRLGKGSLGAAVALDLSGYSSAGDGDPIFFAELQGRYRRDLRGQGQPGLYLAAGPTLGYAGGYIDEYVAGGFFEIGYELQVAGPLALGVSLRERPALFIGDGTPATSFHNTLMLGVDFILLGDDIPSELGPH